METELWPNLIYYCQQQNIPIVLLNARLSAKSYHGYRYLGYLTQSMLKQLTAVAAQTAADGERFVQLGLSPSKLSITGSVKWDVTLAGDPTANLLYQQWGHPPLVWIAASTHPGEEACIWQAYQQIHATFPQALFIWAPRHPERAAAITKLCRNTNIARRSDRQSPTLPLEIFLLDTLGELAHFYQLADVVFVGGSLIAQGGHNVLEPAALAKPIITGPFVFNFAEITEQLSQGQALLKVVDADALAKQVIYLFSQPTKRTKMGQAALAIIQQNRGATLKQLALLEAVLSAHN